jgi:hypothetical protein
LHLGAKAATPEAVIGTPGPRRLHVKMLRDIDAHELGRLFTRGLQDNASSERFSKSIPGTLRMADIFSAKKTLVAGGNSPVDWEPGVGTAVHVNGEAPGAPVKEHEFFKALLGRAPASQAVHRASSRPAS